MSEIPFPDYALPQGTAEAISAQGLRPTMHVNTVLRCVGCPMRESGDPLHGYEVMKCTGLKSGNIYPILTRIEDAGITTSTQETINPRQMGRPPRVLYRLTRLGRKILAGSPPLSGCQRRPMA